MDRFVSVTRCENQDRTILRTGVADPVGKEFQLARENEPFRRNLTTWRLVSRSSGSRK